MPAACPAFRDARSRPVTPDGGTLVTIIDQHGKHTGLSGDDVIRDDGTDTGYDLALVTTDPPTAAPALVSRYAWRWSIEVTFAETREHLGAGQARNRTRKAVERTTPFALYCYTSVVIWYTAHGHRPADIADRWMRQPWYITKAEPAFADMTASSAA